MKEPVAAVIYDGRSSKPHDVLVSVREPDALLVEAGGERFYWPLEHKGLEWERSANLLRLSFGDHPRKVVIVRDERFIRGFVARMQLSGRRGAYDRLLSLARGGPVLFFLGAIAFLAAAYVWVLPFAAERMVLLMPREVDNRIGEAAYASMAPSMDEDTARSTLLQRFGDELRLSDRYELRYHLVKDDQVNAFALPGGHIVVFSGILDKMEGPDELAALLAHEATHVDERHSTRLLARSLASYVFLSLLLGDASAVVGVLAQNADNIRNMGYSRGLESEADGAGQKRLHGNGVDPDGMVKLLRLLEQEASDVPEAVSFLSSHPLTKDRIANAEENARALGRTEGGPGELEALFTAVKEPSR